MLILDKRKECFRLLSIITTRSRSLKMFPQDYRNIEKITDSAPYGSSKKWGKSIKAHLPSNATVRDLR